MIECGERVAKCVSHHVFNTLNGCQQKRQSFAKFCKKSLRCIQLQITLI